MPEIPPPPGFTAEEKADMEKIIRHSIYSFRTQSLVVEVQTKSSLVNCDLSSMAVGGFIWVLYGCMGVTHTVWESAASICMTSEEVSLR